MGETWAARLVPSTGFALFLVINATQVWGGIFPFLPLEFQTESVTFNFYLVQSIAFVAALAISCVGSYWAPRATSRMRVGTAVSLVAAGSVAIIAAMYSPGFTFGLVLAGGVLLGVGTAAFFMLWQRYFSAIRPEHGNWELLVGTALSAPFYFALHAVPIALTAFLVPTVLLPISALCLSLAVRTMSFDQPMFQDVPREHPSVYAKLLRDSWRNALLVAAIGLACGLARGVALFDPGVGSVVNIASMLGSLLAAGLLLALSRMRSMSFDLTTVFRFVYPVVITGFPLFPFLGDAGLYSFAGITYLAFSVLVLVMMMQCAQTSRDRGTNPVFVYGFFAVCAYAPQGLGFLLGWSAHLGADAGFAQTVVLSAMGAYVMGMALFLATSFRGREGAGQGRVELILPADSPARGARTAVQRKGDAGATADPAGEPSEAPDAVQARPGAPGAPSSNDADSAPDGAQKPQKARQAAGRRARRAEDEVRLRDRLSKQCLVARDTYALSSREAEVMELIARGQTVASIADALFISENTVRTHSKHIYTKMDVHSKQELAQLLEEMDTASLPQ